MRGRNGAIQWHRCPEAEADMERLCRSHLWAEVRDEMRRLYGIELTRSQVSNFKVARGIRSGLVGGRFERGHVPANKGRTWDEFMSPEAQERSRRTCFRTGEMNGSAGDRHEPVGTEKLRADGYVWVKVHDDAYPFAEYGRDEANRLRQHRWRQRSHINYERAYGPVPEGCMVFHADGDPLNDAPENLVAVPHRLRATITRLGNNYADRKTLETAMLMAEVLQAARGAEEGRRRDDVG